jgi:queuine tRNA-ribosyltransferase
MVEFSFKLHSKCGLARLGEITTAHGNIATPAFMPVGTCATVKAMMPESVASTGADILLGNTYHLMLRPTAELVDQMGGLHKFMNWHKPILTDSGGYQVMSLAKLRDITEEGVTFSSHVDGKKHHLTPEKAMHIQHLLDSNITMVLDECVPYPTIESATKDSMELSLRWAKRSKDSFVERPGYGIFGIVQGGMHRHLRKTSCDGLIDIGFNGYAIGGLAVGEGQKIMFETLDFTTPELPENKPRYLMGVGKPDDLLGAVRRGIDMFDCVLPTRSGRNGQAFTRNGTINIKNATHRTSSAPIDDRCSCPACTSYTAAYLHHLFKCKEMLGAMLLTWHNLQFYQDLMKTIRIAIGNGYLPETLDELFKTN